MHFPSIYTQVQIIQIFHAQKKFKLIHKVNNINIYTLRSREIFFTKQIKYIHSFKLIKVFHSLHTKRDRDYFVAL
jgi:hypothetical protein